MYFDLNVPLPQTIATKGSKKGKGKQDESFLPAQIQEIETHIDLLVHLGYTVLAFSQTLHKRVEKTHINILDSLIPLLRKRDGILYLKRLNIILDEDSEKGFGLINASTALFDTYDILALVPTTHTTFSLACLTHSQPSPLTAHVIALPLSLPRLPFHLKHTLVRTAIKNGAVFEINYVGAVGGVQDPILMDTGAAESGASAKRNWWAATREIIRVSKGKGLLLSGGVASREDLRAPRDIGNLVTMLGLPQDATHAMSTSQPKSLILRAQTRRTYRAVFSEPKLVLPGQDQTNNPTPITSTDLLNAPTTDPSPLADISSKKRTRDEPKNTAAIDQQSDAFDDKQGSRKKKRKNQNRISTSGS